MPIEARFGVEARCSGCGHVLWRGTFDDIQGRGRTTFDFQEQALQLMEALGNCPECGKILELPQTVRVEPAKEKEKGQT